MRGGGFVLYFSLTGQDHSPQQGGVEIEKGMVLWQEKTIEEEI